MGPVINGNSSRSWLGIFAGRLLESRPGATVASSMCHAVSGNPGASSFDPRKMADSYAAACLRMKARQPTVAQQKGSASSRYLAMFKQSLDPQDMDAEVRTRDGQ